MKTILSPIKNAVFFTIKSRRLLAILALALVMLQLIGCNPVITRPDDWTTTTKADPDMPVITPPVDTTPKKRVALTFDDGPQHYAERTKAIVDEMDKYGFHCTFFVRGNRVRGGDALAYAVSHGNDIGIHSFSHPNFNQIDDAAYQNQLSETVDRIHEQVPDYEVKLLRPPYGNISDERLTSCPYAVINWSVDSLDWENTYYSGISDEEADRRINTIVDTVMSSVTDGDIILMHDIYESTFDATVILLQRLHEEGYEVVSVTELLGDRLQAGRMYYNG